MLQAALRVDTTSSATRSRPTSADQDREGDAGWSRAGPQQHQLGAEARAPSPAARRGCPASGGRSRRCLSSTCSTETDDRLPTAASDSQVSATASRGTSSAASQRLDDLRAAGVADPPADVVAGQAVVGEEGVDVGAQVALDEARHRGVEHDPQARGRRRRSPSCARCRGRAGCASRAPATGPVRTVRDRPRPPRRRRRRRARSRPGWAPRRRRAGGSASTARRPRGRPSGRGGRAGSRGPARCRPPRRRSRARRAAPAARPRAGPPPRRSARRATARRARSPWR